MVVTPRALNRALLARQFLLERTSVSVAAVAAVVEGLVGLQAQIPTDPYVGLAARIDGFRCDELSGLISDRSLVRLALFRSTIHLVTAEDCFGLRPLAQPVLDRDLYRNATHGPAVRDLDLAEVVAAGCDLLVAAPRTPAQLGALLGQRWPDRPAASLAYAVRNLATLVQVPPRGLWRKSGATRHTTAEHWLGRAAGDPVPVETMICRYLAAFGPATVADLQAWSGLTRLANAMDGLRPQLVTVRDADGHVLFDLPDAPRPDPDTPAPPRLLPELDNLFLSHADRRRIIPGGLSFAQHTAKWALRAARPDVWLKGNLLLGGYLDGVWAIASAAGRLTLTVESFRPLSDGEEVAINGEAARLLTVAAPEVPAGDRTFRVSVRTSPQLS